MRSSGAVDFAVAEIEWLRAALDGWNKRYMAEDITDWKGEAKRLGVLHDHLVLYGQEQAAEIERLRAALKQAEAECDDYRRRLGWTK